ILMLSFFYLILVMPYSYRALDAGLAAIDIKTLSEAARSLGAGWGTVMLRVIVPNMSSAILNACLLSVAVVLGEYTFANLLTYENLQVAIAYVGLVSAGTSIAVAVASLLFAFVLLMVLSFVGRPRGGEQRAGDVRRQGRDRPARQQARRGHGVPGLLLVSSHGGLGKRRVRPADPTRRHRRTQATSP